MKNPGSPQVSDSMTRPRASTTTQSSNNFNPSCPSSTRVKHGRATSEFTGTSSQDAFSSSAMSKAVSTRQTGIGSTHEHSTGASDLPFKSPDASSASPTSPLVRRFLRGSDDEYESTEDSCSSDRALKPNREVEAAPPVSIMSSTTVPGSIPETGYGTPDDPLELEELTLSSYQGSTPIAIAVKDVGLSLDELVDRLLSQPMSKADAKFAAIFLCLYRKFAAPAELLSAIIRRFESINGEDNPQIIRISSQLRYSSILALWVADYPGDFAHPVTRRYMSCFIDRLAGSRVFAVAAKEMSAQLDIVSEDDDTEWACSDASRGSASTTESFSGMSSFQNMNLVVDAASSHGANGRGVVDSGPQEEDKHWSAQHSKTPSTSSSAGKSGSQSTASFQTLVNSLEAAQRQAQLLTPITRNPLTKIQWHQFMDFPDEEVACGLTRIDWIMFSSIRPRDLVRHVSLPVDQKEKCKSLEHVNRMINQFNHVALWVANMILLRDKPKHRAKALEKFMGVAWVSCMFPTLKYWH